MQADIRVKEALLKIDNKDRQVVPFVHNLVQREFEQNKTRRSEFHFDIPVILAQSKRNGKHFYRGCTVLLGPQGFRH